MEELLLRTVIVVVGSLLLTFVIFKIPALRAAIQFGPLVYSHPGLFEVTKKMFSVANPGLTLRSLEKEVQGHKEVMFYPTWDNWVLFHGMGTFEDLSLQILNQYGSILHNKKICALTESALIILGMAEEELGLRNVDVFPYNESYVINKNWLKTDLVLFDLNLNTGKRMRSVAESFRNIGWIPSCYLVVLYNDLIPKEIINLPKVKEWHHCFHHLYRASDVLSQRLELREDTDGLKALQGVIDRQKPWQDLAYQDMLKRQIKTPSNNANSIPMLSIENRC